MSLKHYFKKGQAGILFAIIVVALIVGGLTFVLITGTTNKILNEFNDEIQSDPDFGNHSKTMLQDITDKNNVLLDNAFLFIVVGLMIACFISGLTVTKSPIAIIIVIILLFIGAYVGMVISNIYTEISTDTSDDLSLDVYFPLTHFIFRNLASFVVGMVLLFGIGMGISSRIG